MGKCKAALGLLSRGEKGGILHLNDHVNSDDPLFPTVRESLVQKHPVSQPAYSSCIVPDEPQDCHPVIFESLDANAIRSATLSVNGAAGLSGLSGGVSVPVTRVHQGCIKGSLSNTCISCCRGLHYTCAPFIYRSTLGLSSHCT